MKRKASMVLSLVNRRSSRAVMFAPVRAQRLGMPSPLAVAAQSRWIAEHRPYDAGAATAAMANPSGAGIVDERDVARHHEAIDLRIFRLRTHNVVR